MDITSTVQKNHNPYIKNVNFFSQLPDELVDQIIDEFISNKTFARLACCSHFFKTKIMSSERYTKTKNAHLTYLQFIAETPPAIQRAIGRERLPAAVDLGEIASDNAYSALYELNTHRFVGPLARGTVKWIQNQQNLSQVFFALHIARKNGQPFTGSRRDNLRNRITTTSIPAITLVYRGGSVNLMNSRWVPVHYLRTFAHVNTVTNYLPFDHPVNDAPYTDNELFSSDITYPAISGILILDLLDAIATGSHPHFYLYRANQPVDETIVSEEEIVHVAPPLSIPAPLPLAVDDNIQEEEEIVHVAPPLPIPAPLPLFINNPIQEEEVVVSPPPIFNPILLPAENRNIEEKGNVLLERPFSVDDDILFSPRNPTTPSLTPVIENLPKEIKAESCFTSIINYFSDLFKSIWVYLCGR